MPLLSYFSPPPVIFIPAVLIFHYRLILSVLELYMWNYAVYAFLCSVSFAEHTV